VSVEIRAVARDEWRELRDLRLRALADARDAFGSTIERERGYEEAKWHDWIDGWDGAVNRCLVAVDRDARLGMAVGSHEEGRDHIHLYAMWVDPAARRRSVGTALLGAVVDWGIARGAREIRLGVTESNPAAVAFYRRMGFEDTGERHSLREGSDLRVMLMRRDLPGPSPGPA
jgi:ribosomal protein S18 acetylase RimI-like enzyme